MNRVNSIPKNTITFVTGNSNKLEEVQRIIGSCIQIKNQALDLPELQGEPVDVAREKCRWALKHVDGPVLVEDTR